MDADQKPKKSHVIGESRGLYAYFAFGRSGTTSSSAIFVGGFSQGEEWEF